MPLKRTIIEAAQGSKQPGLLLITRQKLSDYSGAAKDRRAARRANVERDWFTYDSATTTSLETLPPVAEKWLHNSHWSVEIQPLGKHNLAAAENDQVAERYAYEANLLVIANALAAVSFEIPPPKKVKVTISHE